MATRLSSTSTKRREVTLAERSLNRMDENLLTRVADDPDMNLDIGDRLQHTDSVISGHPGPIIPSRERVSGMNTLYKPRLNPVCQLLPELNGDEVQNVLLDGPLTSPLGNHAPLEVIPLEGTQESTATAPVTGAISMEDIQPSLKPQKSRNKRKREENLLDGRTELTSDELKEIRETYLQRQDVLRSEMEVKRREREAMLLFDRLLWAVPHDSEALSTIL